MPVKTCSVEGCPRKARTKGLCASHYNRLWRSGTTGDAAFRGDGSLCVVEGCDRLRKSFEHCELHYGRLRRTGEVGPASLVQRKRGQTMAELRAAASATTDDCIMFGPGTYRPCVRLDGTTMQASRAVWILAEGDPGEKHVLHTCHRGIEGCVNRRHLYLGDHPQNMRDMVEAGHSNRGKEFGRRGRGALTDDQVREIRRRYAAGGAKFTEMAREFGVGEMTVARAARGQRYRDVA